VAAALQGLLTNVEGAWIGIVAVDWLAAADALVTGVVPAAEQSVVAAGTVILRHGRARSVLSVANAQDTHTFEHAAILGLTPAFSLETPITQGAGIPIRATQLIGKGAVVAPVVRAEIRCTSVSVVAVGIMLALVDQAVAVIVHPVGQDLAKGIWLTHQLEHDGDFQ
jgi:hypothetical protein